LVVWICYKHIASKDLYSRGSISYQSSSINSHTIKIDSDDLLSTASPPKYEDIIKNTKDTSDSLLVSSLPPPPYKL
jgi:hypothetical protein